MASTLNTPAVVVDEFTEREEMLLHTIAQAENSLAEIAAKRESRRTSESRIQSHIESATRRETSTLSSNQPFAFMKPTQASVRRGFDLRIQRVGSAWMSEKQHCWGKPDELPAEWDAVCRDASVERAVLFYSSEAHKQAQKRKLLAVFVRAPQPVAAATM